MFGAVGPGSTRVGAAMESASNLAMPAWEARHVASRILCIAGVWCENPLLPRRGQFRWEAGAVASVLIG
jgi:hypothetical protein